MAGSGKNLEALVKSVEEILLPKGFTVSIREKIHNDEGIQIAELDVIISGRLGSTNIEWLIECRDRPSKGASPVSWIEQLVGRRDRLGFNKVTAVSTTSFSPGAVDYARESDIELRTVDEINEDLIKDWFKVSVVNALVNKGELENATLFFTGDIDPDIVAELSNYLKSVKTDEPFLIHSGTGDRVKMTVAWNDCINKNPRLFDDVVPGADPKQAKVLIQYINPKSRYMVRLNNVDYHIEKIGFEGQLTSEIIKLPISKITEYSILDQPGSIAQSVHFELDLGGKALDLSIHKVEGESGTYIFAQSVPITIAK